MRFALRLTLFTLALSVLALAVAVGSAAARIVLEAWGAFSALG